MKREAKIFEKSMSICPSCDKWHSLANICQFSFASLQANATRVQIFVNNYRQIPLAKFTTEKLLKI